MKDTKRLAIGGGIAAVTGFLAWKFWPRAGIPPACTIEGERRCFNSDLYECMFGEWELIEENSPFCIAPTRLHGRVRDKAEPGRLIPNVTVEVVGTALSDITDVGGNYHIDNTPFGRVTLRFTHPDYKLLEKTVELTAGINNKIADVFLETTSVIGSISGKLEELNVVTGHTSPMPNVIVNIDGYSTYTDGMGYFFFGDMPFQHYAALSVNGYKPYLISLDLTGDADLGVIEMVREGAEFVIQLDDLKINPLSVSVGLAVEISCRAGLSIAPVGEEVTRTVTLYINGSVVESKSITLVRTNIYWPATATVKFSYTPASAGTYSVEIDGLVGSFEAIGYVNYVTPVGPELAWDVHEIVPRIPERCIPDSFPLAALNRDINIVSVNDIGFDGKTVWYSVEVSHNETGGIKEDPHGFRIYLDIIAESEYMKLVDRINAGSTVTGLKCRELYNYLPAPIRCTYPVKRDCNYWSTLAISGWINHAEAGHPWHEEESNVISHSETVYKKPHAYVTRPNLWPGLKYKVLLVAYYRRTWPYSVDKFKAWLIGEIIFP